MTKLFAIAALLLLSACATLTADSEQVITVETAPEGMRCTLSNALGSWTIEQTPGSASVDRSFSPLFVACDDQQGRGSFSRKIEAQTRGRAYGNILMLGVPAIVDASTGAGYEYEPSTISEQLGD